jgi:hypothetical protein
MKVRIEAGHLGKSLPAGHPEMGSPMSIYKAAAAWARLHPDPASAYSRRRKNKGGSK